MELQVYYAAYGQRIKAGLLRDDNEDYVFEYNEGFAAQNINIHPLFPTDRYRSIYGERDLLPCLFWDYLPSGYNDELLFKIRHRSSSGIPLLKQLAMFSRNGIGALEFEPSFHYETEVIEVNLDETERDIRNERNLGRLYCLTSCINGHTPKIAVNISADKKLITNDESKAELTPWIIKLPSSQKNPYDGAAEYAYNKMAQAAGIKVPETYLFSSASSAGYFGAKRFDREDGCKKHVLTVGALLNKHYLRQRIYMIDYVNLIKQVAPKELENLLRMMIFYIKTGNDDIRGTNISLILQKNNEWTLAPAYDLAPFTLENDYTPLMLKPEYDKGETDTKIYDLCERAEFNFDRVSQLIEQVEDAVAGYKRFMLDV